MIDSDIQNITTGCHHEMIEMHPDDCCCNLCCEVGGQNCPPALDQCGDNPQSTEGRLEMKYKLMPVLFTALTLLVLGLSTVTNARGNAIGNIIDATGGSIGSIDATRAGGIIIGRADEIADIIVGHSPANTIDNHENIAPIVYIESTEIDPAIVPAVNSEILHPIDATAPNQHHLITAIHRQ